MGMFDKEMPTEVTPAQAVMWGADRVTKGVGSALGYGSKEEEVLKVMQKVDPSNLKSVTAGYQQILKIDPEAGTEYKEQMLPFLKERAKGSTNAPKVIKGADGYNYYQDTGQRVLPGVERQASGTALNQADKIRLKELQNQHGVTAGSELFTQEKHQKSLESQRAGVPGEGIKVGDLTKLSGDWRAETSKVREDIETSEKALISLEKAVSEDNATAVAQLNRQLVKLVGDSQISKNEVQDIAKAGSLPERLVGTLQMWAQGTYTEAKAEEIRSILNALNTYSKQRYNEKRSRYVTAYGTTNAPKESISAILGKAYDTKSVSAKDASVEEIRAVLKQRQGK
jgi:ribosomal protein L17